MSVQIASSLLTTPMQMGCHPTATFSDGTHIALFYGNGGSGTTSSLAYALSRDGGQTWSAPVNILSTNFNTASYAAHWDVCQPPGEDALYGAITDFNASAWRMVPFKLEYSGGVVSVTTSTANAQSLASFNPDAGSFDNPNGYQCAQLTVSWDPDHRLYHICISENTQIDLFAFTTGLAKSYSTTLASAIGSNAYASVPVVYVPANGPTGTIYVLTANSGGTPGYYTWSASASAYGTASSFNTFASGFNTLRGGVAILDTTGGIPSPAFHWCTQNGHAHVATLSGGTWTITDLSNVSSPTAGGLQQVGGDLWVTSTFSGTKLIKRRNGVWDTAWTTIDASGSNSGWATLHQESGTLLLLYITSSAVFAVPYLLSESPVWPISTPHGFTFPSVAPPSGSTNITVNDSSAASVDAVSVQVQFTVADTSAASSESVAVTAQFTVADSSSASAEALTIGILLPGDTSGASSDGVSVQAQVPVADTSAASADAVSLQAQVPIADTSGASAESVTVTVRFTIADSSAASSDNATLNTPIQVTDSSGASADGVSVQVLLPITDVSAASSDGVAALTVSFTFADTSSASADGPAITRPFTVADVSGASSDAVNVNQSGAQQFTVADHSAPSVDLVWVAVYGPQSQGTAFGLIGGPLAGDAQGVGGTVAGEGMGVFGGPLVGQGTT